VRTAALLPLDADEARSAAAPALGIEGAAGVEVLISGSSTGLTRYARSQIIQNTIRSELHAHVRVALEDRSGSAGTTRLDAESIRAASERAIRAARAAPPDEDFPGLPDPSEVGRPEPVLRWDDDTATLPAQRRADAVGEVLDSSASDNAAGIFSTSGHCYAVFSSTGIDCYDAFTRCMTTCLVDNGESTGWGEASAYATDLVDVSEAGKRAARKADAGRDAVDAEPGTYEVVLEPSAAATLLDFLSYTGLGAKQVIDGESFLSERMGQKVAEESVTVADDVRNELSVGTAFDFEGVPKRRVEVIAAGIATGPVTDLRTSRKLNIENTGHASGSNEFGPYAANVVLDPGDLSYEELIAGVDEGFLVTRFHYTNVLDRPATLLTGMTRDGIFRISKGEVGQPVHNFRFAQSVLGALAAVTGIGREQVAIAPDYGSYGSTVTPALRISGFNFASRTTH
jgi:PmbA protein